MKYRNNFITNSSSSSFIGVFAKITDKEKAEEILKKHNLFSYVKSYQQIQAKDDDDFCVDWAGVNLLDEPLNIILKHSSWDDFFILWTHYADYYKDEDYDDCDESDFSSETRDIFNDISEENGFKICGAGYGAGYNG